MSKKIERQLLRPEKLEPLDVKNIFEIQAIRDILKKINQKGLIDVFEDLVKVSNHQINNDHDDKKNYDESEEEELEVILESDSDEE
jgi:hypothetical protein